MIDILDKINKYSHYLSKATRWHNSKELISEVETSNTHGQKPDFIYEFKCYIRIINDLRVNNNVKFVVGSDTGNYFPKKPAKKAGKPYFLIENNFNVFQLCAGTKIETAYKTNRAPDISFQYGNASETPTYKDIFMIYDAKFTNLGKKLSYNSFSYFVTMIKDLGLGTKKENNVVFDKFCNFDTNCIMTNTKGINENKEYHELHNLKVVEYFTLDKKFNVIG